MSGEDQKLAEEAPLAEVLDKEEGEFFRDIQAGIYQSASKVIEDTLLFAQIDPADPNPPREWVDRWGPEEAERKLRIARTGWMTQKDAPVGTTLAARQLLGIMKAKAMEEAAPRSLSITLVQGGQAPAYPEKLLDEKPEKGRF